MNHITKKARRVAGGPTRLLRGVSKIRENGLDALMTVVYEELYTLAQRFIQRERPGHTLQATALVHETYLKLIKQRKITWQDRTHFVALAARVMRQVLVQYARRRGAAKRTGVYGSHATDPQSITVAPAGADAVDLIALDELLVQLSGIDERQAAVVELRFFAGLTVVETAKVLRVSRATVEREWAMARTWLYRRLYNN